MDVPREDPGELEESSQDKPQLNGRGLTGVNPGNEDKKPGPRRGPGCCAPALYIPSFIHDHSGDFFAPWGKKIRFAGGKAERSRQQQ